MKKLTVLSDYVDDQDNVIESPTVFDRNITVKIRGSNNRIVVDQAAKIRKLFVVFDCDNGTLIIGPNSRHGVALDVRVGQDATVDIGADVTSTSSCVISAVEGATVCVGDDVMLASENELRADDGHPIFDVATGKRVNPVGDIIIGNHVWLGKQAVVLAGAHIGDGSVIGFRGVVTRAVPNNCIAAGSPARVVRRDIAWERPHLSFVAPPYKPDASYVERSEAYWDYTCGAEADLTNEARQKFIARVLRRFGYAKVDDAR